MKKIDIEKWERPQKALPEEFFNEMQEKVLEKTIRKQESKKISLRNIWSVAAVLVLVFGLGLFLKYSQNSEENLDKENVVMKSEPVSKIDIEEETPQMIAGTEIEERGNSEINFVNNSSPEKTPKKIENNLATKQKMEEVLNSMTNEELAELTYNYEQDPYLELY